MDLKIGAFTDYTELETGAGAALLGLFNLSERPTTFLMDEAADFPRCEVTTAHPSPENSRVLLIRAHRSAQIFAPFVPESQSQALAHMSLDVRGWEILTRHHIHSIARNPPRKVAVLGLLGKMSGAAAVASYTIGLKEPGHLSIAMKALGVLGVWLDHQDQKLPQVTLQGASVSQSRMQYSQTLEIEEGAILEIDLLKMWEDAKLQGDEGDLICVEILC